MSWKAPYRPDNEVTQNYNDGVVTIYSVTDGAKPGYQPVPTLAEKITLRYAEQRLGIPVPRTRGGDPKPIGMIRDVSDCSPHTRG